MGEGGAEADQGMAARQGYEVWERPPEVVERLMRIEARLEALIVALRSGAVGAWGNTWQNR